MPMPSEQTMRQAVQMRNEAFNGAFYYGVITTGVFCRVSCPSRTARPENLRFFATAKSAKQAGFRACRRCRPGQASPALQPVIDTARYIEQHADERLTLASLAERVGLSANQLQRRFSQSFGLSPKAYQEAIRRRRFQRALRYEDSVTDAIFASGFGSTSRVYGESARSLGMPPGTYRTGGKGETIGYAWRQTQLGGIMMAATGKGVCFVQFGEEDEMLASLQSEFPSARLLSSSALNSNELNAWVDALDQHLAHGGPHPDLPLDMRGTVFQQQVWRFLTSLQAGEQLSYSELAERIGKPRAVRAVASACAANRIAVLVPCHRVLRTDGGLGGYRWGLERKRRLLAAENPAPR